MKRATLQSAASAVVIAAATNLINGLSDQDRKVLLGVAIANRKAQRPPGTNKHRPTKADKKAAKKARRK